MRVAPVAYARETLEEVLELAKDSAAVSHNHPAGIAGAQATAGSIFLAREGKSKEAIYEFVEQRFDYDLSRRLADIRPTYTFDVSCAGSVPESIIAFLESDSIDSAIRLAISLGGDADTMACIAGAVAEPFYGGISLETANTVRGFLDDRQLAIVDQFSARFISK